MERDQNQTAYKIIGFTILAVTLLIMGFLLFLYKDDIWIPKTGEGQEAQNVWSLELRTTHNDVPVAVQYQLRDKHFILVQGQTATNQVEIYSGVDPEQNYTLKAWSKDYYIEERQCRGDQEICEVRLEKVAEPFITLAQTGPQEARIFITKEQYETVRAPVFCIEHSPNLFQVHMDLPEVPVLEHYVNHVDRCFKGEDFGIWEQEEFPIYFTTGEKQNEYIRVILIDRGINIQLMEQYGEGNMDDITATTTIK